MNQRDLVAEWHEETGHHLEFLRTSPTKVHVVRPDWPEQPAVIFPVWTDPDSVPTQSFAEVMTDYVLRGGPRRVTICGRTILVDYTGGKTTRAELTDTFPDPHLCHACREALGDQAPLAFEHPQGS